MEGFDDIKITGIDTRRPPRVDLDSDYVNVFFELSQGAPPDWCQFFNATLQKSEVQAFIDAKDGRFIESISLPEKLPLQLEFLKGCVGKCNQTYRSHLVERAKNRKKEEELRQKRQKVLQSILEDLDF